MPNRDTKLVQVVCSDIFINIRRDINKLLDERYPYYYGTTFGGLGAVRSVVHDRIFVQSNRPFPHAFMQGYLTALVTLVR